MDAKANLKHKSALAELGAQAALVLAWISGIFSLVLCIIVIVNHIQVETADPLDDEALIALRSAIAKDPQNVELRESVRALHLMARRAFFTSQSQLETAGTLLLFGCIVFLISARTRVELRQRLPQPFGPIPAEGGASERATYRWAVAAGAALLVLITFVFVYLSPPPMDLTLAETPAPPSEPPPAEPAPAPVAAVPEPAAPAPAEPPTLVVPAHAWPNFRGPGGLGVAHHADAPLTWNGATEENVMWKSPIPKTGTNSPVAWGGRVFVMGGEGRSFEVYAFDGLTGSLLWTGALGEVEGSPKELPKLMDGVSSTPSTAATDGERVYGIFVTGDVAAFSADSGSRVWARHLGVPKNSYGHASSLVVHGGKVYVQLDDQNGGRILALDARTGATAWEQKREVGEAWSTPAIVPTKSRLELVLVGNPWVSAYDPSTGKPFWSVKCMGGEVAPSPAWASGLLYAGTDHAAMVALQPAGADAKELWRFEEDLPDVASPVATETALIMCSSGGIVTCLDPKTGAKRWMQEFDEGFYGSPIAVGDRVYVMDMKGVTHVFRASPDKYEKLAANPLGEKANCTPAIPEGRIYLRSDTFLYCIAAEAR